MTSLLDTSMGEQYQINLVAFRASKLFANSHVLNGRNCGRAVLNASGIYFGCSHYRLLRR